jgi:hypothetical protein
LAQQFVHDQDESRVSAAFSSTSSLLLKQWLLEAVGQSDSCFVDATAAACFVALSVALVLWNLDEESVNAEITKKLGDDGGDGADKHWSCRKDEGE